MLNQTQILAIQVQYFCCFCFCQKSFQFIDVLQRYIETRIKMRQVPVEVERHGKNRSHDAVGHISERQMQEQACNAPVVMKSKSI